MKNIYMLQVNFLYGKTAHLPYTAALLLSCAFADEEIKKEFAAKEIFFIREKPDGLLAKIENPSVIGFSSYIWNFEYNKYIAKKIKEKYPECVIIFGGHHVSPGGGLLTECPFIDYLIHGEGEAAFTGLLKSVIGKADLTDIPGISFRLGDKTVTNPSSPCNGKEINLPSPYLNGFLDDILAKYSDLAFMGLIETSRGCPNSCAYCDWSNMKSRIRTFPLQRVYDEIRWMGEHRILGLGSADSNFGCYERDEEITDYLIETYKTYSYPKGFQTSYAKNSNERIFRIGCKLEKYRLSKGITLSFQSMDDTVLENIGRKNISVTHYRELMDLYNSAGIPTYTELILGLPGETPQSLEDGIDLLLRLGQHHTIYIHNCEWLPCSMMGTKEYTLKYQIQTARIPLNQPHIETEYTDGITEYSELVVSTLSMTRDDWVYMNLFSFTVQCFHHLGLLQFFALYLYREKGVAYRDFYSRLLQWLLMDTSEASRALQSIKERLRQIANGNQNAEFTMVDERFGRVHWPFEEYLFLCTVYALDGFYEAVREHLRQYNIKEELFEELLSFQRQMIKRPFFSGAKLQLHYNFAEYFAAALENKPCELKKGSFFTEIKARYFDNWCEYAKFTAWYGRKDNRSIYLFDAAERNETDETGGK